jgi:hypothetical protein
MRKKVYLIYFMIMSFFSVNAFAYEDDEEVPNNIGLSLNLLGPLFGEYSVGVSSFLNSRLQIGVQGSYYDTNNVDPKILGWQAQIRMNYFFTPLYKSGFYLGIFGGFESVQVQNNSGTDDSYNDPIGGLIPGYRWAMTKKLDMLLGVMVGYMFGNVQLAPELTFVYVL